MLVNNSAFLQKKPIAIKKDIKKKEYNFDKSSKKLPITGKFM